MARSKNALATEYSTVLPKPFLSTGMGLFRDIFIECLTLHFEITDDIRHTFAQKKYCTKKLVLLTAKNMIKNKLLYQKC